MKISARKFGYIAYNILESNYIYFLLRLMNFENLSQKSDEELASLASKNEDCFYELMNRYESKLLRYILRLAKINQETAEDILQDTYIKAYKYINNFDPSLKFSSWIYRIAHNETISYWRKNQKNVEFVSIDKEDNGFSNTLTDDKKTDTEALHNERQDIMKKVINNLPEKYRDVLILRYLEEKEYEEISDILQKPIGTVSALIHRAKSKLKKEGAKFNLDEFL